MDVGQRGAPCAGDWLSAIDSGQSEAIHSPEGWASVVVKLALRDMTETLAERIRRPIGHVGGHCPRANGTIPHYEVLQVG
jgi:hypothetical protein